MSTKLLTFTSLLALASALPTTTTLTRRQKTPNTDCTTTPGTQFYTCANGYTGCFAQDPCALPPLSSTSSTPSTPSPTPTLTRHEIPLPSAYNIYPQSTSNLQDPVPHIDLKKEAEKGIVTTSAIYFPSSSIPANAQNCHLNWRTDTLSPNNASSFFVTGRGGVYTRQLLGFPSATEEDPVTDAGLNKWRNESAEWSFSMDFTGWEGSVGSHAGPSVRCGAGQGVAVELKGQEGGEGENRVFIANTETNGVFLSYDLVVE